jgi:iron-sulfur cluster repair protein YtfE (RIC family)
MGKPQTFVADDLRRAHAALFADLQKLEEVLGPASRTSPAALCSCLGATHTHLTEHFRFEEQTGYMDALREQQPRLEHAISQLVQEHRQLTQRLAELRTEAGHAERLDDALREKIREWIRHVLLHEAHENDLVQDAVNLDIGTKD